ncbi:MAG: hypothetical protein HOP29_19610 [Phycisphaerales bacterium]|nr:hypothetical protein [Phycisphaerales bacterium]
MRLTDGQRRMVAEHVGLVGMHLKRHVPGLEHPSREREWDDLFQEGCIGLATAAAGYDPSGGIPFPAFAQRRIQQAVGRALHHGFQTVRTPEPRPDRSAGPDEFPRVVPLDREAASRRANRRHRPDAAPDVATDGAPTRETIGDAIRRRYDLAVMEAVRAVRNDPDAGGADRGRLVERVAAERVSIPDEAYRVPLRQVVKTTGSSYARVHYAERRLTQFVRNALAHDAEMDVLRQAARRSPDGVRDPLEDADRRALHEAAGRRFAEAFAAAPEERQCVALLAAMRWGGLNPGQVAGSLFRRMDPRQRARLTEMVTQPSRVAGDGA